MLDLSKRSRSGKFRLVTKFKKEKNNKNREARSSLGAPGTCPLLFSWPPGLCGAQALLSPWPRACPRRPGATASGHTLRRLVCGYRTAPRLSRSTWEAHWCHALP